jgi:peroxiredoxin (alkyl hydroperoxide reductase subunit C)
MKMAPSAANRDYNQKNIVQNKPVLDWIGAPMPLRTGQIAPDFCLESHLEKKVCLSDYLGKKTVVLVFYPLAWTPI